MKVWKYIYTQELLDIHSFFISNSAFDQVLELLELGYTNNIILMSNVAKLSTVAYKRVAYKNN